MTHNPNRFEPGWPSAVIASAHQTGVLGMRNLARRGVPVCCIDCDTSLPGFNKVYGPAYRCPNPDEDGDAWLRFMLDLARTLPPKPALIPASDRFVAAIARHARELGQVFRIGDRPGLQGELAEKASLYTLATQHGMPIPRTEDIHSEQDLLRFVVDAQFPCLLKPMSAREWECFLPGHPLYLQKVATANNPADLLEQYALVREASPAVVAQEIIAGPDTAKFVYFSCYSHDGSRIASALVKELRCLPAGFGCPTVCETAVDPEIDELCDSFLRKCGCRGLCEIELKRDSRTGRVLMIEANPRLSGSGDAAPHLGVDLAWIHYLDLAGIAVQPVTSSLRNLRHIVLSRDAAAIRINMAAGNLSWRELFRSYRPPIAFYDLDPREWRTAIQTLDHALRSLLIPIVRRLRSRVRPVPVPDTRQ